MTILIRGNRVAPWTFDDFTSYTGADDNAKTTSYLNNTLGVYNTSEDKVLSTAQTWTTNTAYSTGDYVSTVISGNARTYQCASGGTSAPSGTGPSGTGSGIVDNTATWNYFQDNQRRVFIDTTVPITFAGRTLPAAARFDFHDRTPFATQASDYEGATGRCHDYELSRKLHFPGNAQVGQGIDLWFEYVVRYGLSPRAFITDGNGAFSCATNPDKKDQFVRNTPDGRWQVKVGTGGLIGAGQGSAVKNQTGSAKYGWNIRPPLGTYDDAMYFDIDPFDGQPHHVQLRCRLATGLTSNDGLYRCLIDGQNGLGNLKTQLGVDFDAINTPNGAGTLPATTMFGMYTCSTLNQGPHMLQSEYWYYWGVYNSDPGWGI